jgi:hypothetical protein
MEPSPPETSDEPAELVETVQQAAATAVDAPPPDQEPEPSDELVSWGHAQDRLDHERHLDQPKGLDIDVRELVTTPREEASATP